MGGGGAAGPRVPRTTSVNSYKNYQALPAEQQAALAEALQDEGVLAAKMDGVVAILQRANQLPTNEDGEVELDLRWVWQGGAVCDCVLVLLAGWGWAACCVCALLLHVPAAATVCMC